MTDFDDERLDSMAWWSRKGQDNLLCTFDYEGRPSNSRRSISPS